MFCGIMEMHRCYFNIKEKMQKVKCFIKLYKKGPVSNIDGIIAPL